MAKCEQTPQTRADQIYAQFVEFHHKNPIIWGLFEQFTIERIRRGFKHYSSDAILHRIRWETATPIDRGDGLKINNNYTPYYARLFMVAYPEHQGFFRNRKRTSENQRAANVDIGFFYYGDPGDESVLTEKLAELLK